MALDAGAYAKLPTERPNPRTRDIDLRSPLQIVRLINAEDRRVALAVGRQARAIARGVEALRDALAAGGRALIVGAGTSGRLGVLEAAECPPTFGTPPSLVRGVIAGGRGAMFKAKEGAEDDARAGGAAVAALRAGDCVIGVAASGVTPFVHAALSAARKKGCRTILVTSNGRPPRNPAEVLIAADVGPEVLTGSTRLKSGTAAKLVLNTLTTAAMVGLGKIYDHWMVDLRATNRKLRLRAERVVAELGRVPPAEARRLFEASGRSVKVAVVMARGGLPAREARRRLTAAGGFLRRALENL